jgi:hypothetical protein
MAVDRASVIVIGVAKRRRHEPTRPGNPNKFTIEQHVHSRSCVKRFANVSNLVSVWEFANDRCTTVGPGAQIFCAQRVWDQRLEHGAQTLEIEDAFLAEAEAILKTGRVTNHDAVSAYLSLWQIRSDLREQPPEDVQLAGIEPSGWLTKEQEENVEARHGAFARGNQVPGRFIASLGAITKHDQHMRALAGRRWGVLHARGRLRYICPDRPDRETAIPLTRTRALVAGVSDQDVGDETVADLNRQSLAHASRFIFGHPDDVRAFRLTQQTRT